MSERRLLLRALKAGDMAKRIPRRKVQPLRDYPLYTIPEAAFYLAIPERTLRYWITSHPLWLVNHAGRNVPLLSFHDIAQAYYIEVLRRYFRLTIPAVRRVLKAAKIESTSRYPLLKENIRVFEKHVIMDLQGQSPEHRRMIDLSQHPQYAMPDIVEPLSTRIRWDSKGDLVQIYPWRKWSGKTEDETRPVTIDPDVMSGRLVISGTRIPVEVVALRKNAGAKIEDLAEDYRLSEDAIRQALDHLAPEKKAA